jgi:membrane associated rhomboid family serine protease
MGIYDREYYRRDGSGFLASFADRGQVCKWLILANIAVFILQVMSDRVTDLLLLDVNQVAHGQVWRLLTYAFLHQPPPGFPWHILINMLFLWWFGKEIEDLYGSREFLCFYLIAALLGGLAFTAWGLTAQTGLGGQQCLGASGAVTAVMVLYALHFPHRVIYIWFVLPVPIWAFVVFQVAQDAFIFASGLHTTTAVTVHLAGAAFGYFYHKRHWRLANWWPNWSAWRRASRSRLRVYREDDAQTPVTVAAPPAGDVDEHLEAKVDAVLEKVARYGQASLTDSERQILVRASEVYKRRRT